MGKSSRVIAGFLSFTSFVFLTACNPVTSFTLSEAVRAPAVCNPFSDGENFLSSQHGLVAKLSYIPASKITEPGFVYPAGLDRYVPGAPGVNTYSTDIFLNQLNVPPRLWTSGFSSSETGLLKTASGDTLVEWFSLSMRSSLIATVPSEAGHYILATHSDDGSRVRVDQDGDGVFESLVENDGDHASRCRSANRTIELRTDRPLPIQVDYYQGPREAIAIMLIWKKVADPQSGLDSLCQGFQRMTWDTYDLGPWSAIPARHFLLPGDRVNSCGA